MPKTQEEKKAPKIKRTLEQKTTLVLETISELRKKCEERKQKLEKCTQEDERETCRKEYEECYQLLAKSERHLEKYSPSKQNTDSQPQEAPTTDGETSSFYSSHLKFPLHNHFSGNVDDFFK
jgi:hypothetical protein